jgi:hypothetical protein
MPKSGADIDFLGESEPDDDDVPEGGAASDDELFSPTPTRTRKAARKARAKIQKSFAFETRTPQKLKAPVPL